MFGAAADVIALQAFKQQPPLYISNLIARIRNLANVGRTYHR
jgi:hypothetical protein